ncbi:hypothetical protein BDA96_03G404300 [Sorghum bicolor]|uniref:Uncharacterized protein n=1 Tax=Sorghum bicolor TaxID=4558 RepID=A0A921URB1_SORBI|nr:hypothetical protein BDA96_03G404300 [Sorghum bicolor]
MKCSRMMDIHGSTRKMIPLRQVSTSAKQYLIRITVCFPSKCIAFVRLWFTCINGKACWNLERTLGYHRKSDYLELSQQ